MQSVEQQAAEIALIQPAHIVSFLVSYPSLLYHTIYISPNTKYTAKNTTNTTWNTKCTIQIPNIPTQVLF